MARRAIVFFKYSAGAVLLVTAMAKLFSSAGSAHILQADSPLLGISFRHFLWMIGATELLVAAVCLFGKRPGLPICLVAWLATDFLIYRLCLMWVGNKAPCHCLGNLTDALHLAPQTADTIMKISLAYLLIGSYAGLFWLWRQKRNAALVTASPETGTGCAP